MSQIKVECEIESALIWRIKDKQTDIIPTSILQKKNKIIGSVVSLTRIDISGKVSKYKAKIIAIHESAEYLKSIIVNNVGEICNYPNNLLTLGSEQNKTSNSIKARRQTVSTKKTNEATKTTQNISLEVDTISDDSNHTNHSISYVSPTSPIPSINSGSTCGSVVYNEPPSDCESSSNIDKIPEDRHGFSYLLPFEVTQRDINHFEHYLSLLKSSYKLQQKNKMSKDDIYFSDEYTNPGEEKVEISPGCGIYLPMGTKFHIEKRAQIHTSKFCDWRIIVRAALIEIYGNSISNYSARGTRSNSRPPINAQVFRGLHEWASRKTEGGYVPMTKFIQHINKISSNKRKYISAVSKKKSDSNEQKKVAPSSQ